MKTFEEYERLAYMNNLPKVSKLYAQLDDNENSEYDFERLREKLHDVECDCEYYKYRKESLEHKIEILELKIKNIQDTIDE